MKQINQAYQVLRDPVARWQYHGTLQWNNPSSQTTPSKPRPTGTIATTTLPTKVIRSPPAVVTGQKANTAAQPTSTPRPTVPPRQPTTVRESNIRTGPSPDLPV